MNAAIVVALSALVGSIFSTFVTVFAAPIFQARRQARTVLATYREPLLAAAYELQARLHTILCHDFVEDYIKGNRAQKNEAALHSTLYVFAQFFGWTEIIRMEVQFLRFSRDSETRDVARLLRNIREAFLSDAFGPQFMIWRVEQRGFGERMITTSSSGKRVCLGYAAFLDEEPTMKTWLEPLHRDLLDTEESGRERLTKVQHLLLDLVRRLDEGQTRYPFALEKA
jgi:hypothetical protein